MVQVHVGPRQTPAAQGFVSFLGAAELFFTVGSLLSLAFGPFLWGVAWLRSMDTSRWLGWTAILTGLTGLVWFVWLLDTDIALLGFLLIANVLVSFVLFRRRLRGAGSARTKAA